MPTRSAKVASPGAGSSWGVAISGSTRLKASARVVVQGPGERLDAGVPILEQREDAGRQLGFAEQEGARRQRRQTGLQGGQKTGSLACSTSQD